MAYIHPPSDLEWQTGSPPSIGWWPCSLIRAPRRLRYWDGAYWSVGADCTENCVHIERTHQTTPDGLLTADSVTINSPKHLEWAPRWWEAQ